jgi:hypothetical protein
MAPGCRTRERRLLASLRARWRVGFLEHRVLKKRWIDVSRSGLTADDFALPSGVG